MRAPLCRLYWLNFATSSASCVVGNVPDDGVRAGNQILFNFQASKVYIFFGLYFFGFYQMNDKNPNSHPVFLRDCVLCARGRTCAGVVVGPTMNKHSRRPTRSARINCKNSNQGSLYRTLLTKLRYDFIAPMYLCLQVTMLRLCSRPSVTPCE